MTTRILAITAAVLLATPAFADLPGLPRAQDADARPAEAHPAPQQSAPIRGSLFKQGAAATAMPAAGGGGAEGQAQPVSMIAVRLPEAKRYHKNDIVTIIVREDSDSSTTGQGNAKKTQDFDFAIQQFLQLALSNSGVPTVGTVNNPSNLPEVKFKYSDDRQHDAQQQRTDTFSARISGTIVDIKPNGTMVVEATKGIYVDKEQQVFRLTGVCRADDIQADNTVLSTQLANLTLSKQTKGTVHDNGKTGWLNGLLDKFNPF